MEQNVSPEIVKKWEDVIEGKGEWKEFVESSCPKVDRKLIPLMAQTLENAAQDLNESTNASAIGDYKPILIPMLRRIVPAQIGPRILGTWAMTAPNQQIFALRATYQNTTANPVTRANSQILTVADGTTFVVGGDITGDGVGGNNGVGVVRHKEDNNLLVEITSGTFIVGGGVDDANPYAATVTTISAIYDNEALFQIVFKNYAGLYATATGEALTTDMKEVGFKIDTATMTAESYKLKAKWTEELEDDLRAIHNMNAEQILSTIASEEIDLELNQTVIDNVRNASGGTVAWDYSTADGRWELEKYQNLMAVISRVKREIAVATRRGQATFMIVSPAVLAAIEHAGRLDTANVDPAQSVMVGRALGMDVFCDIYATSDAIYLGYKGNTEMDAGIFYGVYKPIQVRKGYGEESGQPRSFFRSRVAFEDSLLGVENYYRTITVSNLPS